MSSSIGTLFKLSTFGESHGLAIGGVIDGCPSGLKLDFKLIQDFLNKRRPGLGSLNSQRQEFDKVEFMSGIFNDITLGTPIGFIIKNIDSKSKDYDNLKNIFRPSHADFTYEKKYGIRDYRGGGRSSARETANWVVAGAIASQILKIKGINIFSYVSSVGGVDIKKKINKFDSELIYNNDVRCPCPKTAQKIREIIAICKSKGDTVGGCISTVVKGVPFGLGEPVFNKFQSGISKAIMGINACKGIAFGSGFSSSSKTGSEENDAFIVKSGSVSTSSNNSGGVQGGISNGQDICFHASFKPVSTIMKKQKTVDDKNNEITVSVFGRHDSCVVPRAVPIVESLTAITILDYYLLNKTTKISDI
jgi:chorismate synthase|tara:strand:- start:13676 stop:14761 length:1086 start_codon:yes stop_codon:yes gene_type:complete